MNNQQISKYLSLLLRHQPELGGLTLDNQGWTSVNALIDHLQTKDPSMDRSRLEQIVATNNKKRFAFHPLESDLIRAQQGHSIDIQLEYSPIDPPAVLFHGTAKRFLPSIWSQGLLKGGRHHVHLSADLTTASLVGKRHGKLVILEVDTSAMSSDGFLFYRTPNGVWLTEHVPAEYLKYTANGLQ